MRRFLLVAIAATLVAGAFVPVASADHCRTKLVVYGRVSTAPIASPPYTSMTAGMCLALYGRGVDDHVLPPETDQVTVRINGDFGGHHTTILIELDGLGFANHTFHAVRQASPFGGVYYQFPTWVALPNGTQTGDLTVTAYYPTGAVSAVYHVVSAPDAPAPPPPP